MSGDARWKEIRGIHEEYRFLYEMLGGLIVLAASVLIGAAWFGGENEDYRMNLFTEGMGIVATVFIINRWYAYSERRNLQNRLIREAGSRSHDIAISAVEWMDREGWLCGEDGLLKGADLREARLWDVRMDGANLEGANLENADLRGANLNDANMRNVDLSGADLRCRAKLRDADLSDSKLSRVNLEKANLQKTNLNRADLSDADLKGANLVNSTLNDAMMLEANLETSNLYNADLKGANLMYANLKTARWLNSANLQGADLSLVDLEGVDLCDMDLSGARIQCVDLRDAKLFGTNLQGADLRGTYLEGAALLPKIVEPHGMNLHDSILPDGKKFTEGMGWEDIERYIDRDHPEFEATLERINSHPARLRHQNEHNL